MAADWDEELKVVVYLNATGMVDDLSRKKRKKYGKVNKKRIEILIKKRKETFEKTIAYRVERWWVRTIQTFIINDTIVGTLSCDVVNFCHVTSTK